MKEENEALRQLVRDLGADSSHSSFDQRVEVDPQTAPFVGHVSTQSQNNVLHQGRNLGIFDAKFDTKGENFGS